jgi:hypothetical protein
MRLCFFPSVSNQQPRCARAVCFLNEGLAHKQALPYAPFFFFP